MYFFKIILLLISCSIVKMIVKFLFKNTKKKTTFNYAEITQHR